MLETIEELILIETQSLIKKKFSNFKNQKDEFFISKILETDYASSLEGKRNHQELSFGAVIHKNPKKFIETMKVTECEFCQNILAKIVSLESISLERAILDKSSNKIITALIDKAFLEKDSEYKTLIRRLSKTTLISNSDASFKSLTSLIEKIKDNCAKYAKLIENATACLNKLNNAKEQSQEHPDIAKYKAFSQLRLPKASKTLYEHIFSIYESCIRDVEDLFCNSDAPIHIMRFIDLLTNPHLNFEKYTQAISMFNVPEYSIKATYYKEQLIVRTAKKILLLISEATPEDKIIELQLTDILKKLYAKSPKDLAFPRQFFDQIHKVNTKEQYHSLKSIIDAYFKEKTKIIRGISLGEEAIALIETLNFEILAYNPFEPSVFQKLPSKYKQELSTIIFSEKNNFINTSLQKYLKFARECSPKKKSPNNHLEEQFLEASELLLTKTIDTYEISKLPPWLGSYLQSCGRILLENYPLLKNFA